MRPENERPGGPGLDQELQETKQLHCTHSSANCQDPPLRARCRAFRALEKNTLRGFAVLSLEPLGLTVSDIAIHEKNGQRWLSFPAKSYPDKTGSLKWFPLVEIQDKNSLKRFQAAGLAAIDCYVQRGGGR